MAIIIRPNGGINNAMAGLAAGFGQGMQLGQQAQQIDIQRKAAEAQTTRAKAEGDYREGMLKLAQAADTREQTRIATEQEVGGKMAEVDQLGAVIQSKKQKSLDDYAQINRNWLRLQANPSMGIDPKTGQELPGAKWLKAQAVLGPQLSPQDLDLLDDYQQKLNAAFKASANLTGPAQANFRAYVSNLALRDLDANARDSFAKSVATNLQNGSYRIMQEDGSEIDDPTISARVQQLTEAAADPNVPINELRSIHDNLLKEVNKQNEGRSAFIVAQNELRNLWQEGVATGNTNKSQAARAAHSVLRSGVSGPALQEAMSLARQGLVKVYDENGQSHNVPPSEAEATLSAINGLIQRQREAEVKLAEANAQYRPEYLKGLGAAAAARAEGASPQQRAAELNRIVSQTWNNLGEQQQDQIQQDWPKTHNGEPFSYDAWAREQGVKTGGTTKPQQKPQPAWNMQEELGNMTPETKAKFRGKLVDMGVFNADGSPTDLAPEQARQMFVSAALEALGATLQQNADGETVLLLPNGKEITNPKFMTRPK